MGMFQAAIKLGISQDALAKLVNDGAINARFIRGELMFTGSDLEEYLRYTKPALS